RTPVVMPGGVAKSPAAVRFLERALAVEIHLPPEPQIAGAYGAALLALDDLRARDRAAAEELAGLERDLLDRQIRPNPAHGPSCAHCQTAAQATVVPLSITPVS